MFQKVFMETVKIESESFESGFVIINKEDFDESQHKIFVESDGDLESSVNLQEKHTRESLSKKRKGQLVAILEGMGVVAIPDKVTNKQLIDEILRVQEVE